MENSKIEWTDHTFNPWIGCTKVSPGCKNCYAEALDKRWGRKNWGPNASRTKTSAANWKKPLQWEKKHEEFFAAHGRRQRVFCASLADVFELHPNAGTFAQMILWRAELFALIEATPHLDWLLLTKRPQNVMNMIPSDWGRLVDDVEYPFGVEPAFPRNVWIGTTVENQETANERIPHLLKVPARVRFLSCEPMVGPVDLQLDKLFYERAHQIQWVICGGESGHGARPMHPDWARSLRDQCAASGVPFLFKQWGEWSPGRTNAVYTEMKPLTCMKPSGELSWWSGDDDTTTNYSVNYNETDVAIERMGKKAAGRLLDGVEHNGFPA